MSKIDTSKQPSHIRIGLEKRKTSIRLRLRWNTAPKTCAGLLGLMPISHQVWHAKYANNEIYTLSRLPDPEPPRESLSVYPSRGDLVYLPLHEGIPVPGGVPGVGDGDRALDVAYFYEAGNSLLSGPHGPIAGTIVATAETLDDIEEMAEACRDVWFAGAAGEQFWLKAD